MSYLRTYTNRERRLELPSRDTVAGVLGGLAIAAVTVLVVVALAWTNGGY